MDYFDYSEFDSPDLVGSGKEISKDFLAKLNKARHIAGIPFKINSGVRSTEHNEKIGGAEKSSHLITNPGGPCAADIAVDNGWERFIVVQSLLEAGISRIGVARSFVHADSDQNKPDAIWTY